MTVSIADLKIIASNGGGMVVDANTISSNDLKILASNASHSRAKIFIKNCGVISSGDMKIIASNSKGCVVFDFVE
jgi:hypothetical protein